MYIFIFTLYVSTSKELVMEKISLKNCLYYCLVVAFNFPDWSVFKKYHALIIWSLQHIHVSCGQFFSVASLHGFICLVCRKSDFLKVNLQRSMLELKEMFEWWIIVHMVNRSTLSLWMGKLLSQVRWRSACEHYLLLVFELAIQQTQAVEVSMIVLM